MPHYIGRFAPSPTGPLHAGSLVAALASYLDARVHGGQWLLRIDDADLSRVQTGAAQTIAQQLAHYGFQWHGAITHTQDCRPQHIRALQGLQSVGQLYGCTCTRSDLVNAAINPISGERVYSGFCRDKGLTGAEPECRALRLRVGNQHIAFTDRWAGEQRQALEVAVGDMIVWRPESVFGFAGGLYSYQFTMPCDDAAQGVSHVVRGADLLASTVRQLWVYDTLGLKRPSYLHVPVVLMDNGSKLSKQNHAPALPSTDPLPVLEQALTHLCGQASGAHSMHAFWHSAACLWEQRLLQAAKPVI